MVVNANIANEMVATCPPTPGMVVSNAAEVRDAPVSPEVQAPEVMIANPVMLRMISVSMKVPNIATRPLLNWGVQVH
jgi:hypothetical protein